MCKLMEIKQVITMNDEWVKKKSMGHIKNSPGGEIAQQLRALTTDCSSKGSEFDSQQPHGGSQLSFLLCV